ncbi:hypothetical protein [uncultured Salinicola sp.]|uniref:hypothetical protein n=1 Tax=uncultured Salinicola sp. TaxID=1193542 RepID=UPI0026132D98|nr:hypothetical protein [uncultured Salinicola sp.]|tara:strand:+ start:6267 stop:7382 length:1116 start_codon:yes stop_codon:yes gene_type:complete
MQFEHQNDKGENYALLYPKFKENEELKSAAEELGVRNALEFNRGDNAYRLFEAKIPEDVNVDAKLGKFATDEAKAASMAEREEFLAKKAAAAKATGTDVDQSKVYVAAKENGDRDRFNKLRQETGTSFTYSSRQGGFVHKDGPTEGFEYFQSEEAKKAWAAEAGKAAATTRKRRENAVEGIDVMAERANGRVFLADNSKGFMLPSKKQEAARSSQLEALKAASPEEVAQVYKITEAAKKALDRKLYGIQLNAAKDAGVEKSDFDKMKPDQRREAAKFKGLEKEEFSKLVSLSSGFFAVQDEMVERGMLETRQSARDMQNGTSQSSGAAGGKQEGKSQPKGEKSAEKAESKAKGGGMAAALAAGAEAQGVGR